MATTQTKSAKKPTVHFLHTYRFRQHEKDPVIDRIRTVMEDTGFDIGRAAKGSGVAYGTIYNWLDGPTRKPQYCTIAAVARAMGHDLALIPTENKANGKGWDAAPPRIIKRFRSA